MAENSGISWTDHTFNPWIGCTHVTEACRFCYAERDWDHRFHRVTWGPSGARIKTSDETWGLPLRWNAKCAAAGIRQRVFCASLADIFDDHPSIDAAWRRRLWEIIAQTQNLDWLLLTKRPHNFPAFLPVAECRPPFEHVRLGVSICEQRDVHFDMVGPLQFASYVGWKTFISYEPAIGPTDWDTLLGAGFIDWLIAGGESGPMARASHPTWFRSARDACLKYRVPFHFKQWGEWMPYDDAINIDGVNLHAKTCGFGAGDKDGNPQMIRVGRRLSGRRLDGRDWNEFPRAA